MNTHRLFLLPYRDYCATRAAQYRHPQTIADGARADLADTLRRLEASEFAHVGRKYRERLCGPALAELEGTGSNDDHTEEPGLFG